MSRYRRENRIVSGVTAGPAMAGPMTRGRRLSSAAGQVLRAPFTRQAWAELGYALVSVPLAIAGFLFTVMFFGHPLLLLLLPVSTPVVRRLADANRFLARRLLGVNIPALPPVRAEPYVRVTTPEPDRLAWVVAAEGAHVLRQRGDQVKIAGMPATRVAELAAADRIAVADISTRRDRMLTLLRDTPGWRARGYLVLKLPVSLLGVAAVAITWLCGLAYLTFPVWWEIFHRIPITVNGVSQPDPVTNPGPISNIHVLTLPGSFLLIPIGAALLLAAPRLTHQAVALDQRLMRRLLGPASLAERVRDLEESRARLVDDSAARLRSIERDLHDGTQAQLVGLAMKLGLAREKLSANSEALAAAGVSADLDRAAELVDAAHRGAIEAITELRTLVRGIHPPVLDNGLPDALATLASRSAVPVELVTDLAERPSAAIETIAYFCAAELLANVAKHSGARHAVVEAVLVPGLLRLRVRDDGHGGAGPDASGGGGLRGLADRIRPVDGRMDISSPRGGPTVVTVELPSRA
jgi:signal transduction histidine kinase